MAKLNKYDLARRQYKYAPGSRRIPLIRALPPDFLTRASKLRPPLRDPIEVFIEKFELPRLHFMPVGGVWFDKDESLAITASMDWTDIINLQVPSGMEGVIKSIGQDGDLVEIFTDARWRVLINGGAARDWGNVSFQRGTLIAPTPITVPFQSGSLIQVQIQNTSAANTYTAYARLVGWYWPVKERHYSSFES